jgi:transcriptional regulator with GAF, ATPase, and Fis domain
VARKHGLFEVADGGTLFLDEIGDLGAPVQARILRALDTGTFRRVGGVQDVRTDARIVCATNRVLSQMVKEGEFRQDLYFRINVVSITLPPLRERREDIPKLARYFAEQSPVAGKGPFSFSSRRTPGLVTSGSSRTWWRELSSLPTGVRSRPKIFRATFGTMPAPRFES